MMRRVHFSRPTFLSTTLRKGVQTRLQPVHCSWYLWAMAHLSVVYNIVLHYCFLISWHADIPLSYCHGFFKILQNSWTTSTAAGCSLDSQLSSKAASIHNFDSLNYLLNYVGLVPLPILKLPQLTRLLSFIIRSTKLPRPILHSSHTVQLLTTSFLRSLAIQYHTTTTIIQYIPTSGDSI